jgi:hypothetical protein
MISRQLFSKEQANANKVNRFSDIVTNGRLFMEFGSYTLGCNDPPSLP